jgi:hypothetical protein
MRRGLSTTKIWEFGLHPVSYSLFFLNSHFNFKATIDAGAMWLNENALVSSTFGNWVTGPDNIIQRGYFFDSTNKKLYVR